MERLLNVEDMMVRYQCSRRTAIRYMRMMEHMEKPLMVSEKVLRAWERSRTVRPVAENRRETLEGRLSKRVEGR